MSDQDTPPASPPAWVMPSFSEADEARKWQETVRVMMTSAAL